ncbi:putative mitochondrial carrier domain-containing protein [Lupinus albus]|uniref:Putative mitochondrial carrier domain-containing protein n=1 Tax=Lupinus albus TaxID=3870 RepID=A0A6A4QND7_LUPAL|nr:putative mitochondrial carrier domain-containing protein [Lupinus albus]
MYIYWIRHLSHILFPLSDIHTLSCGSLSPTSNPSLPFYLEHSLYQQIFHFFITPHFKSTNLIQKCCFWFIFILFSSLFLCVDMGDVAKDLTAGTVGGAAQLICGHPFDTIKVKLQSQPAPLPGQPPKFSGAIDAVKQTIAAEGAGGLYKGMGAPLATVAAFNAVLFTVRGQMETLLRSHPGAPLTVNQQFVCGAGAGLAVSFLACPTELIKCRLQAQSALAGTGTASIGVKYGGPLDVARHVLRSEGGAKGLFKGLIPTMAREIPGNAIMFGVYEATKQMLAGGTDTSGLGRGSLIVAGGLAGGSFWFLVYPTDVVKSVLQVDDYKNPRFSGSLDAFRKIKASEGFKGLYKGFGPAMGRSVPANAACFLAYEMTRSALG